MTFLNFRRDVWRRTLCRVFLIGWTVFGSVAAAAEPAADATDRSLPPLDQITESIERHFRGRKDFEPGDLISRSDVQGALDRVKELGWDIPNRAALEKLVLPDDAFLVVQLRTKAGVRFMRKIANNPGGYDRLDRLSDLSGGRRLVKDLIRGKGGHEFIEYLATSQGGARLGRMLVHAKGGSDLNKPTGRLYTVDALVKAVAKIHREQSEMESAGELP